VRDYQTLSEPQIRNLLGGGALVSSGSVARPPLITAFVSQTQVTIPHNFETAFLSVTVYIENGAYWNELPRTSYAFAADDTECTVTFDGATTGICKLAY